MTRTSGRGHQCRWRACRQGRTVRSPRAWITFVIAPTFTRRRNGAAPSGDPLGDEINVPDPADRPVAVDPPEMDRSGHDSHTAAWPCDIQYRCVAVSALRAGEFGVDTQRFSQLIKAFRRRGSVAPGQLGL